MGINDKAEGAADKAFVVTPPRGRVTTRSGNGNILFFAGPAHPSAFLPFCYAPIKRHPLKLLGLLEVLFAGQDLKIEGILFRRESTDEFVIVGTGGMIGHIEI